MNKKTGLSKGSITIKDVAEKAGVSIATASRALSGRGYISSGARERVRQAARQLNYRINASARSLKVKRTNTIGLIITDITNPFYAFLAGGVLDCAQQKGYHVILCASNENPDLEKDYLKVLLEKRVDGIIAVPTGQNHRMWREVQEMKTHLVLVDRETQGGAFADLVLTDNIKGACIATDYLIRLGHRRIGIICGPSDSITGRDRLKGYQNALQLAGIPFDPQLTEGNSFMRENGYHAMQALLALPEKPTAVLVSNNVLGEAAITAIRERGLHIPQDISFVMFDDVQWASLMEPSITVVSQPVHQLGYISMKLLDDRLQADETNADHPPVRITLEPELIQRESCRPVINNHAIQAPSII